MPPDDAVREHLLRKLQRYDPEAAVTTALSVGEPGSVLDGWPLWLGLFLPAGFVLAMVGAAEETADGRLEAG